MKLRALAAHRAVPKTRESGRVIFGKALKRILLAGYLTSVALLSVEAHAESVQAVSADDFVEFIGVNIHLNWAGTIWQTAAPTWRQRLGELGIRYVRTAMARTPFARDNLNTLYRDYGVRANLLLQPRKPDGSLDKTPVNPMLYYLRDQVGAEKIVSFEGPNEYSQTKYADNTGWANEIRSFQSYLHIAVKSSATFAAVPVIGPTIWRRLESDYAQLGDLSSSTDLGNLHYYNAAKRPTRYARQSVFPGPVTDSPVDMAIDNALITTPGEKIQVTETGFNIRMALPPSRFHVSERTSAKYTLRMISEFFWRRDRVEKTYLFSLLDEGAEKQYGLLRPDMSPRPSFYAIKNAITLLSDKGEAFPLGTLTYYLAGDTTDIRSVVLQKRDGRFYMLIWLDAISYDQKLLKETDFARPLTLDVRPNGSTGFAQVNIYHPTAVDLTDPDLGTLPVQTLNFPGVIALNVPDHLMVIEMIP